MSELAVDLVEGAAGFAALRGDWNGLIERSRGTVFSRWEWQFAWWSQLACRSRPVLLTARDEGGALRGLLPLLEQPLTRLGPRRWSLLGDRWVGSDGLGPLLEPGREPAAGVALAKRVALLASRWELLRLAGLPAGIPWIAVLRGCLSDAGIESRLSAGDVCPVVRLSRGQDPIAASPKRVNLERRRRWLARQPSFRIDCASAPGAVDDALTWFLSLHDLRWSAGSDAVPAAALVRFHREAAALLSQRGLCRIYLMWLHGRPVAAVYALVDRGAFYYYLPAFDPAWGHRSVGTVLLGATLDVARAEGFERFELLRGEESYKADWADARWQSCTLQAAAPRPAARALGRLDRWQHTARALASQSLPSGAVWRWRRAVSRLSLRASNLG
ncbi:MAG: GNAT family N-acetyltransferase [Myxococcales bacterium]